MVLERTGLFLSTLRISLGTCNVVYLGYVLLPFGDLWPATYVENNTQYCNCVQKLLLRVVTFTRFQKKIKRFCFENHAEKLAYFAHTVCYRSAFGIQRDLKQIQNICFQSRRCIFMRATQRMYKTKISYLLHLMTRLVKHDLWLAGKVVGGFEVAGNM